MAMEHRCSGRMALRRKVGVSRDGYALGDFLTRDIDSTGAFIEACGLSLRPYEYVELCFADGEGGDEPVRCTAVVVRCCSEGVGVMFWSPVPLTQWEPMARREIRESRRL